MLCFLTGDNFVDFVLPASFDLVLPALSEQGRGLCCLTGEFC